MPQGVGAGAGHYPKLASDPALASWQYVAMTVLVAAMACRVRSAGDGQMDASGRRT